MKFHIPQAVEVEKFRDGCRVISPSALAIKTNYNRRTFRIKIIVPMILEGMEDKNIEEFSRILESRKKLKIR